MAMKSKKEQAGLAPLVELDLTNPHLPKGMAPVALRFEETIYRLTSWQELIKIFCYIVAKHAGGEEFFASHANKFFYFSNGTISLTDSLWAERKIVFCDYSHSYDSDIKFSSDYYIRQLDLNKIVAVINYIIRNLNLKEVAIYFGEQTNGKNLIDNLLNILNKDRKKHRFADKKAKCFIARIDNEVLLPQERLYRRIESEFNKKVLIGDISISDGEENLLRAYMKRQLRSLNERGSIRNYYCKVFAYGLVRYAMKYYSQKTFWPYFKKEYGIEVPVYVQGALHDEFRRIMEFNHKAYDNYTSMKIDNISMHSFVTDHCADQLFDYLFDFWRLDLNRNIENIYGKVGKEYFDLLLCEMKAATGTIMTHTALAVKAAEKSCRLRLRRILELMDDCFWTGAEVPRTGNRINELLRKWMQIEGGKFQKEQQVAIALKKGGRGHTLLSSPMLCAKYYSGTFYLRLPREILKNYSEEQDLPVWKIKIDENIFSVAPMLCEGKIGYYTEECELSIPSELLFGKISITLDAANKTFTIKESPFRFFGEKGTLFDHEKKLPCGFLILYSATSEIPQKIYGEETIAENYEGMFVATYQAEEGDIFLFPDKKAVQTGRQICEGLIETPLKEVVSVIDGNEVQIYEKLPKILFKAKREQLDGAALFIEKDLGQHENKKVKENYIEFKLDDALEDVYGYLIDLQDYIKENGFYRIRLSLPSSVSLNQYQFIYLKDLDFCFEDAPYIFAKAGKLSFPRQTPIEIDSEWECSETHNTFPFVFGMAASQEVSPHVLGKDVCLNYLLPDRKLPLKFHIPAFYWKYKENEDWYAYPPADLSIRNIPNALYVCGPFDFKTSRLSINHKSPTFFDETELSAQKKGGEDYYLFPFGNFKSFLDHSVVKRIVSISLNGNTLPLLDIICRSYVVSAGLSADYDEGKLIGKFEILGGGEYSVKVERNGKVIGQDIPLVNSVFELEANELGGEYLVTLYEIFEDDSGFDAELAELGQYSLKVTDVTRLQIQSIEINSIQNHETKYSLPLSQKLVVGDLKYLGRYHDVSNMDVVGLWSRDFGDEEQMRSCFFYRGILASKDKEFRELFSVMIIFFDQLDLTKCVILREYGGEYIELLYDYKIHSLTESDEGLTKLQKKERIETLEDDRYDIFVTIGEQIMIKTNQNKEKL